MRNIKKIFTLVLSLILLLAVSCDTESKTGVKNNPPENDTEITGGGSGTGGSGEGGGGTETPPSEPETTETIDAKDFPTELLGTYEHYNVSSKNGDGKGVIEVSTKTDGGIQKTHIHAVFLKDNDASNDKPWHDVYIAKWKKTTKGEKIIKLEGECNHSSSGKYTITYDYETKTLSGTLWQGSVKHFFKTLKKIS